MEPTSTSVDEAGLTALFREKQLELVRMALFFVGDRPTAEDVVQDVFARVCVRWERIGDRGNALNDRLAAVGWIWAFAATTHSEQANAHYRGRRDRGDRHAGALRHLFNRMLGQLYYCLQTGQHFNPTKAFPTTPPRPRKRLQLDFLI